MNNVLGGQHSLVKNVRGSLFWGVGGGKEAGTVHYDTSQVSTEPESSSLVVRAVRVRNRVV